MAYMGEIRLVPFATPPKGWALCNGQLLPAKDNLPLFSLLGTSFGGDGQTNFALPTLDGRVLLGASYDYKLGATEQSVDAPSAQQRLGSLALNYVIATQGGYPPNRDYDTQGIGEIRLIAADYAPQGWFFCDGRTLSASDHPKLANVLKTTFGGDANSFRLPDLGGRVPVGAGTKHALGATSEVSISSKPHTDRRNAQAVTVSYIIAGDHANAFDEPYLGEIRMYAFEPLPEGFAPCHGALPIYRFTNLFPLLRTHFGGDGRDRFDLPDLIGRVALGHNDAHPLGQPTGPNATAKNGQPFCAVHFRIAVEGIFPPRG